MSKQQFSDSCETWLNRVYKLLTVMPHQAQRFGDAKVSMILNIIVSIVDLIFLTLSLFILCHRKRTLWKPKVPKSRHQKTPSNTLLSGNMMFNHNTTVVFSPKTWSSHTRRNS